MTAPRLVRRAAGETTEYRQPVAEPEPEEEAPRLPGISRTVRFEVPDGFMATISLVPYRDVPPEEPT